MALDEGLRRRLEALNRGALPATQGVRKSPQGGGIVSLGGPPALAPGAAASRPWRGGCPPPLAGLVRRGHAAAGEAGEHWRITLPVDDVWPGGERLVAARCQHLAEVKAPFAEACLAEFIAAFPDDVVLLDLETCGFAGSALFLVGLLRPIAGRLTVELLLARNYAEEPAVLASLWQAVGDATTLVTFNGKSFDWPMVVDRSRRHLFFRGRSAPAPRHLDLLHVARRRWKNKLPNCKLQTLEQHICGRVREADIPGSQIPAAYQHFVQTGFEREMDLILRHNALDLVTMLDLAMRLAG